MNRVVIVLERYEAVRARHCLIEVQTSQLVSKWPCPLNRTVLLWASICIFVLLDSTFRCTVVERFLLTTTVYGNHKRFNVIYGCIVFCVKFLSILYMCMCIFIKCIDYAYDNNIVLQRPCSLPFPPTTPGADSEEVHHVCKRLSHVKDGGTPLKSKKVHDD